VKIARDVETQTLYAMKIFSRADMTGELQRKVKEEIVRDSRRPTRRAAPSTLTPGASLARRPS